MPTATMTSKGQLTVPKEVRDALHLKPGTKITFHLSPKGDEVVMRAKSWDVSKIVGMITPPPGVHLTMDELREAIQESWGRRESKKK